MSRFRLLASSLAMGLLMTSAVQAATFVVPADEQMIDHAPAIVSGVVTGAWPRFAPAGGIETVFSIAVDEVLKGAVTAPSIDVVEWGGQIGSKWMVESGAPRYEIGKRYLVFLIENRDGAWTTQDLTLGRFEFTPSTSGELLLRDAGEINGWDVNGNAAVESERNAGLFVAFIRERVQGRDAAADYFAGGRPAASAVDDRRVEPDFADYDFDDACSVGVNSWKNDSGSNVSYSISGTAASSNGKDPFDSEERIIEEDPNDVIGGTFTGVGVVATAFYGNEGGTHLFETKTYTTISGSDVVTQNGVKDSALGQNKLRSTLVHEIGHTLGFRHSNQGSSGGSCSAPLPCTSSAIMNSSIVSGLDGVLQTWDADAVRAAYGSGGDASDYATTFGANPARREDTSVAFRKAKLPSGACTGPTINTQPASKTIASGLTTTLTVSATASEGALTFQWFRGTAPDTSNPVGTNSSTLTTDVLTVTTSFWVRITDTCSTGNPKDSNTATVTIPPCTAPSITSQPPNRTITSGASTTLSVSASGTTPRTYQWYIGTAPDDSNTTGSNSNSIQVSPTTTTSYWVTVSNSCGSDNSTTATVTVTACPAVTVTATASAVVAGNATLTADGTSPGQNISYRWFRGTTPGSGGTQVGTQRVITVAVTEPTSYWVRATSSCDQTAVSNLVTVAPCTLPSILTQPLSQQVQPDAMATLTLVLPDPSPNTTVTWYRGAVGDKTTQVGVGTSISVGPVTEDAVFWAEVSNSCGAIASNAVAVHVVTCALPEITTGPLSQTVKGGTTVTVSVVATGAEPLHYQWFEGAANATDRPIGIDAATLTVRLIPRSTSYWVRVTDACGQADSAAAQITVTPSRRRAVR